MRGGTSKALVFHERDLPADKAAWPGIFMAAMGTPDSYARQLNGMGGGVTSVSKVCVVSPPSRQDADVDYTFYQVMIAEARVSLFGTCGNMSSAIGPFAVDEDLVDMQDGEAAVRIHTTNTGKIIRSRFFVRDGRAVVAGDCSIPGVSGTGAPVLLDFLDPGGATTGKLLPTGNVVDRIDVPGLGMVEVSIVDAANLTVFVSAERVGLKGTELAAELELSSKLALLHAVGRAALHCMGKSERMAKMGQILPPMIAIVSAPQEYEDLSGAMIPASGQDLCIRMLSSGIPHRALPVTGSVCTAVAAAIEGTLPHRYSRPGAEAQSRRLGMPSGIIQIEAEVTLRDGIPHAESGTLVRTARRLFDGFVHYLPSDNSVTSKE